MLHAISCYCHIGMRTPLMYLYCVSVRGVSERVVGGCTLANGVGYPIRPIQDLRLY